MEFNEVANTPIDVELMGKSYKVRRVSLQDLFGKAEASVISMQMKRIHEMAEGLDGDDKSSFLAKAMLESLPTGQRLNQMTASFLRSVDGVKMLLTAALRTDQPNIEKELNITDLVSVEAEKVTMIISFATARPGDKAKSPLAGAVGKPPAENQQ